MSDSRCWSEPNFRDSWWTFTVSPTTPHWKKVTAKTLQEFAPSSIAPSSNLSSSDKVSTSILLGCMPVCDLVGGTTHTDISAIRRVWTDERPIQLPIEFMKQIPWPSADVMARRATQLCCCAFFPKCSLDPDSRQEPNRGVSDLSRPVLLILRSCNEHLLSSAPHSWRSVDVLCETAVF